MKSGEINECVSGQKEIRNKRSDGVKIGDYDKTKRNQEGQDVTINRFVVLAIATTENLQIRIQFILAKGLKYFGSRDETGEGRAECSGKATGVNQWTKC